VADLTDSRFGIAPALSSAEHSPIAWSRCAQVLVGSPDRWLSEQASEPSGESGSYQSGAAFINLPDELHVPAPDLRRTLAPYGCPVPQRRECEEAEIRRRERASGRGIAEPGEAAGPNVSNGRGIQLWNADLFLRIPTLRQSVRAQNQSGKDKIGFVLQLGSLALTCCVSLGISRAASR
jgi:hypothetical protein